MPWQLPRRPSGDINHRWDRLTPDISPNHFLAITCCFCHTSYHPEFPPFVTLVLWNNCTHRSHSDRVAFVSCNKHRVCEVFNHLQKKWRYAQNCLSHPSKKGAVSTTNPSYRIHFWLHRSKKRAVEDVKDSERSIPQLHQDKDSGRSMMMLRLTWHQFYRQSHGEEVDTTFKSDSAPFSTMHVAQMALHTMDAILMVTSLEMVPARHRTWICTKVCTRESAQAPKIRLVSIHLWNWR